MAKMLENLYTQVVSTYPIAIQKGPEVSQLVLYPVTIHWNCVIIETSLFEVACSNKLMMLELLAAFSPEDARESLRSGTRPAQAR